MFIYSHKTKLSNFFFPVRFFQLGPIREQLVETVQRVVAPPTRHTTSSLDVLTIVFVFDVCELRETEELKNVFQEFLKS